MILIDCHRLLGLSESSFFEGPICLDTDEEVRAWFTKRKLQWRRLQDSASVACQSIYPHLAYTLKLVYRQTLPFPVTRERPGPSNDRERSYPPSLVSWTGTRGQPDASVDQSAYCGHTFYQSSIPHNHTVSIRCCVPQYIRDTEQGCTHSLVCPLAV